MVKVAKNTKKEKPTKPETSAASKTQSGSSPKLSTEETSTTLETSEEETKVTEEKIESAAPQTPNVQTDTLRPQDLSTSSGRVDHGQEAESSPGISIELEAEKSSLISRKLVVLILVVLVLGGLVVGGILFYRSRGSTTPADEKPARETVSQPKEEKPEVTETSPSALITEEEPKKESTEINLVDYSVQLLNGSGVAGEAGRIKDILETEGFEKFDVDNADSYDYTDTEVSLKKDVPKEVFEKIKSAMKDYTVVEGDALKEDTKYDVSVIIGQKKE